MESTFSRVRVVLTTILTVSPEKISPETDIVLDLAPDSLEVVEIITHLEDEFGVNLGDDNESLGTVSQVVELMDELVARQGGDLAPMM